jgi:hypothetical protein
VTAKVVVRDASTVTRSIKESASNVTQSLSC